MQNLNEKYEIYQKRLAKKASRLTSLMNDAKWLKLCEILEASGCKGLRTKLLSSDEEIVLVCGFGCLQDGYFDCANGAILFKDLYWVFVPKFYEQTRMNKTEKLASNFIPNPLEAVLDAMTKAGKFDYEIDEIGLKIYGYR
ncbi:hypothetical protein [uncultured Campylobacter sp.]|uniref:hypothetical protein n=1 Tax=uncultured Campylobacter sp. TaxID=218934 RepID=UPI00261E4DC2|nr:hypothetical protein [uncultured Campylobacter sp.]